VCLNSDSVNPLVWMISNQVSGKADQHTSINPLPWHWEPVTVVPVYRRALAFPVTGHQEAILLPRCLALTELNCLLGRSRHLLIRVPIYLFSCTRLIWRHSVTAVMFLFLPMCRYFGQRPRNIGDGTCACDCRGKSSKKGIMYCVTMTPRHLLCSAVSAEQRGTGTAPNLTRQNLKPLVPNGPSFVNLNSALTAEVAQHTPSRMPMRHGQGDMCLTYAHGSMVLALLNPRQAPFYRFSDGICRLY